MYLKTRKRKSFWGIGMGVALAPKERQRRCSPTPLAPLQNQVFLAEWKRTNAVHVESANYGEFEGFLEAITTLTTHRKSLGVIFPIVSFNSFASLSPANAICLSTTVISFR